MPDTSTQVELERQRRFSAIMNGADPDTRFRLLVDEVCEIRAAMQTMTGELREVRGFVQVANHNSTESAAKLSVLADEIKQAFQVVDSQRQSRDKELDGENQKRDKQIARHGKLLTALLTANAILYFVIIGALVTGKFPSADSMLMQWLGSLLGLR